MLPVPQSQYALQATFSYYRMYIYWCACKWECFSRRRMEEIVGGGFVLFTSLRVCNATDNTSLDGNEKCAFVRQNWVYSAQQTSCAGINIFRVMSIWEQAPQCCWSNWKSLSKRAAEHCRKPIYGNLSRNFPISVFKKLYAGEWICLPPFKAAQDMHQPSAPTAFQQALQQRCRASLPGTGGEAKPGPTGAEMWGLWLTGVLKHAGVKCQFFF